MKYAKAFAAFVGGLTPGAVVGFLALVGVDMDAAVVASLLATLTPFVASIAAAVAPKNTEV